MPTSTLTDVRVITYRFSGSIVASSFPGIRPGDRFFGRLRYGNPLAGGSAPMPGCCFADPDGFIDAGVGAVQLRSCGPFGIRLLDGPAMLRLALISRRPGPGAALIPVGAAMLVSPPYPECGADMLRTGRFVTRSFTVEDAETRGTATGALDMLYPLDHAA